MDEAVLDRAERVRFERGVAESNVAATYRDAAAESVTHRARLFAPHEGAGTWSWLLTVREVATPKGLSLSEARLDTISKLATGWDGPGSKSPSNATLTAAAKILGAALEAEQEPDRIVATYDGGVSFYFFRCEQSGTPTRYASIFADEDADLFCTMRDRSGATGHAFACSDVENVVEQIGHFLDGE